VPHLFSEALLFSQQSEQSLAHLPLATAHKKKNAHTHKKKKCIYKEILGGDKERHCLTDLRAEALPFVQR